ARMSWERVARVMAPKAVGAWHLHLLTRDAPLDFFVLYSSMASVLRWAGQSSYAAANAFLDALAHHRHHLGLPALSVNWGAWAGGGMVAGVDRTLQERWASRGVRFMPPERALVALEELIADQAAWGPQVGAMAVDWSSLLADGPEAAWPLLDELAGRPPSRS